MHLTSFTSSARGACSLPSVNEKVLSPRVWDMRFSDLLSRKNQIRFSQELY